MRNLSRLAIMGLGIAAALIACGPKAEEDKSKIQKAVKDAVTKELQMYDRAKKSLETIEQQGLERRESEKEIK